MILRDRNADGKAKASHAGERTHDIQPFASVFRELRRELCRINTSRKVCLTALQNSLDIDSIARNPAPEAKFQVSQAPGALRLAGSNRDETSPCGLLDESNLTVQQNSLDIDSIARKPAPEAKFQVSAATGRADACRIYQK